MKNEFSCLNDYQLVALLLVVTKVFERLVKDYIIASISSFIDSLQFAYKLNGGGHLLHPAYHHNISYVDKKNRELYEIAFH